jgi:ribosomal protein S18 acetylase RimI-like enzyme
METRIAPARVREAEAILKLQYLCFQAEAELYNDYTIAPLTQPLADLLAQYDTHRILVIRSGEEVVGSVRGQLVDETCQISRLCVHPRLQGRGLGTRLMHAIEADMVEAKRFELFTGHLSEQNLRLYRRLGYTDFREVTISPDLRFIYLEKYRAAGQ